MEVALQATETALEAPPRIAPVPGATSRAEEAYRAAESLGITLYPWQRQALWVMMETKADGLWRYLEWAGITSRRNGKTKILLPRVKSGLERGERFIHTAHNRGLPRQVLLALQVAMPDAKVRTANGQEEIQTREGGRYIITAPQRGARGEDADVLIVDELREIEDFDLIAAAEPVLAASPNPQVIYLSNAGTEQSVILNDLKNRADKDPNLAYMEWSADPLLPVDDREAWRQANPGMPYGTPSERYLEAKFLKYKLAGELAIFETEHLCRWVASMMPRLLQDAHWQKARGETGLMIRPSMGISVAPEGNRVSVAWAWQDDGRIHLMCRDFHGDPINVDRLGQDLQPLANEAGVETVGFDPWTDQHLARHFTETHPINGAEYANASERFVRAVETGQLVWELADAVSADLPHAARKATSGKAFIAERAKPERPITAVLAAVRAVWLASQPRTDDPFIF